MEATLLHHLRRRLALSSWSLCLLLAVMVVSSNAQVYLSSTGNEWDGSCDGSSCNQGAPCQLSSTGTTWLSSSYCDVTVEGGTTLPQHEIMNGGSGIITFDATGPVSLSGEFKLLPSSATLRVKNFHATTASRIVVAASNIFFESVNIEITGTAQIQVATASIVTISQSVFKTQSQTFFFDSLAPGATILLEEVDITTIDGISQVSSMANQEPSITIRDSVIDGLLLPGSNFNEVRFENVTGFLGASQTILSSQYTSVYIADSNIEASGTSRLMSSTATSLTVLRSDFKRVRMNGIISGSTSFDTVSVMLDNAYVALDYGTGYGTAMTLKDVAVSILFTDYVGAFSWFKSSGYDTWDVQNLTFSASTDWPRMKLTPGNYAHTSDEFVAPSMVLGDSSPGSIVEITNDGKKVTLTGDLTSMASTNLNIGLSTALTLHSIHLTDVILTPTLETTFTYHVTDPLQGIVCNTADCFNLPAPASLYAVSLSWDSELPLPEIGTQYPYFNSISAKPNFVQPADFSVDTQFQSGSGIFTYSFNEVSCAAHCVAANSGQCVSRSICTCQDGFTGVDCEILVIDPVPVGEPVAPPIAIEPVQEPVLEPAFEPTAYEPTSTEPTSAPLYVPSLIPTYTPLEVPISSEPLASPVTQSAPEVSVEPTSVPFGATPVPSTPTVPSQDPTPQDVPTSASQHLSLATSSILGLTCLAIWIFL